METRAKSISARGIMWDGDAGGIPQPLLVSATVERGLSFLWFNWARNHFRCNTRADAAAMSSNHRKSSTSLPPTLFLSLSFAPFSHHLFALPRDFSLQPFNSLVESKKPPSSQSLRVLSRSSVHLSILYIPTDDVLRDAFSVIKTVARVHKGWHHIPLLHCCSIAVENVKSTLYDLT